MAAACLPWKLQEIKQMQFFPSTRFRPLHCSLVIGWSQVNANATSRPQFDDKVTKKCTKRRTVNAPFCFSQAYHLAFPVKSNIPGQPWHKEKQHGWEIQGIQVWNSRVNQCGIDWMNSALEKYSWLNDIVKLLLVSRKRVRHHEDQTETLRCLLSCPQGTKYCRYFMIN